MKHAIFKKALALLTMTSLCTLTFSTAVFAAEWVRLNPKTVSCDFNGTPQVAIYSNGKLLYASPRERDIELIAKCNRALEQAKFEGKAVFVSSEGEIAPEGGFYFAQEIK